MGLIDAAPALAAIATGVACCVVLAIQGNRRPRTQRQKVPGRSVALTLVRIVVVAAAFTVGVLVVFWVVPPPW